MEGVWHIDGYPAQMIIVIYVERSAFFHKNTKSSNFRLAASVPDAPGPLPDGPGSQPDGPGVRPDVPEAQPDVPGPPPL